MSTIIQTIKNGEKRVSVENKENITVEDLYDILGLAIKNNKAIKKVPVALCLNGVETETTVFVKACNEGDDSVFWLFLCPEVEKLALKGF